jgi:hypothetical protein
MSHRIARVRARVLGLVAGTALVGAGMCAFAAPAALATSPGDDSGVITVVGQVPSANGQGQDELETMRPDGTGDRVWWPAAVPVMYGSMASIQYSPDGSRFLLSGSAGVWLVNADGSDARRVLASPTSPSFYPGRIDLMTWGADSAHVVFVVDTLQSSTTMTSTVVESQIDGAGQHPLFTVTGLAGNYLRVASNGDVAYQSAVVTVGHVAEKLVVWHRATGTTTVIENDDPARILFFDFAPDGNHLVVNDLQDLPGLYVTSTTSPTRTLVGELNGAMQPVWSPDGTRIAAAMGNGQVEVGPSGSTQTPARLNLSGSADGISWQPTNARPVPAPQPTVDRVGGQDRVDTAVDASRLQFADATSTDPNARKAAVGVLSRMDTFADALAGSALAGEKRGPLLLTQSGSLDPRDLAELHRTLPRGATVYLLGGANALSTTVENQVKAAGFVPKRLQGANRYATSVAIAHEITPHPRQILVATGDDYPDALGAGAVAATQTDSVVILTPPHADGPDHSDPSVARYFATTMPANPAAYVTGVGGQVAWTQGSWVQVRFKQVAGSDRFQTAADLLSFFGLGRTVGLATGNSWADALAGGAVAGSHGGGLVLADRGSVPPAELAAAGAPTEVMVFGGTAAVPQSAVTALTSATRRTGWVSYLNRSSPTLQ